MAFNHTISAIMRGKWMIDRQWASDHLPLVLAMLQGKSVASFVDGEWKSDVAGKPSRVQTAICYAIDPATMERQELMFYDFRTDSFKPNPNLKDGSVGVMPITGPLTKYNGSCGEPGMIERSNSLMGLLSNPKIGSIVQLIDTPGGEARAASGYAQIQAKSSKPILSYIDGMCASLGMWQASGSQEVYLSDSMDQMGSVGSYCTLMDFTGYFEKEGIKLVEIYAPQSTDKNKPYRDAIEGDTTAIEQELKLHVDQFISYIKTNRPKAASTAAEWSTGKIFYAADAVKLGLADGVAPMSKVISKAAWLAKRNKQ